MELDFKKVAWIAVGLATIFLLILLIGRYYDILKPLFIGILLVCLASPFVDFCEKKKIPRTLGMFLFYLTIIVCIGLILWIVVPYLIRSIGDIILNIPEFSKRIDGFSKMVQSKISNPIVSSAVDQEVTKAVMGLKNKLGELMEQLLASLGAVLPAIADFGVAIAFSMYFMKDFKKAKQSLLGALPEKLSMELRSIYRDIKCVFSTYVRGQLIVTIILAVMTGVALWFIGVRFAPLLGLLAGIFDLIPYFGATLATIPIMIIAYLDAPMKAVWSLLAILLIQQIENNIISPKITGDSVGLHPAATILVVFAGAKLFGFWGILFAIPAAGICRVLGRRLVSYFM